MARLYRTLGRRYALEGDFLEVVWATRNDPWMTSVNDSAREARKRAEAERLNKEVGPKLSPEFRFGAWSNLPAQSEPLKSGPDF